MKDVETFIKLVDSIDPDRERKLKLLQELGPVKKLPVTLKSSCPVYDEPQEEMDYRIRKDRFTRLRAMELEDLET